MSYNDITRITGLSMAFHQAVVGDKNAEWHNEAFQNLIPGEKEDLEDLIEELAKDVKDSAFNSEKPSEEFLKKNISLCEMTAKIFSRVMPEEKLAGFVPKELKNQDDADLLYDFGAEKLARLCEFKK